MLASTSTFADIEEEALDLQRDLWDRQFSLWPGEQVTRLDVCDPWMAAYVLGFEVQEGWIGTEGARTGYKFGGFLNRSARLIGISDQLSQPTKRFTLAHEVGHILRHPGIHHHREMPIAGITEPRVPVDRREREANHFAGVFLVPTKLLQYVFKKTFGVESLRLTDDVAFELLGSGFPALMNSPYDSIAFERVVAEAKRFRGRHFDPLHVLFRVSPTTMAIRLRECGLVYR